MDALHFGHWLSERRRACGWRSQHALVAAAQSDAVPGAHRLSEDFVARLEAGRLRHPFRGSVRQRVLALAWLLCPTRRDLDAYLAAAGLLPLSEIETPEVERLREHLRRPRMVPPILLPPRPPRLVGRDAVLDDFVRRLCSGPSGLYAITGMVGIGKSALVAELLHRVAAPSSRQSAAFRDGIVTMSMTGWQGTRGLLSLLQTLSHLYPTPDISGSECQGAPAEHGTDEGEVIRVVNQVRAAVCAKEALLVLDDLDPRFPLRLALDALLVTGQPSGVGSRRVPPVSPRRIVLVTSRFLPPPALTVYHHHLEPLEHTAAVALLSSLLGRSPSRAEHAQLARICRAVGHLPLAIEAAASAIQAGGIPLALLAERTVQLLLSNEGELRARLGPSLEAVGPEALRRLSLLPLLGSGPFDLAPAAALDAPVVRDRSLLPVNQHVGTQTSRTAPAGTVERLSTTAGGLAQLVRHSLLEVAPATPDLPPTPIDRTDGESGPRYTLHPLLRACAWERSQQLDPEVMDEARSNLQAYALTFLERYAGMEDRIAQERGVLLAALTNAWRGRQHAVVLRVAAGLIGVEGRLESYQRAVRVLHWGLEASRHEQDPYMSARFLNRLGRLLLYHGDVERACRVWDESMRVAESLRHMRHPTIVWRPLGNLALIAGLYGEHEAAENFANAYHARAYRAGGVELAAVALSRRGMCARVRGDDVAAYDDLSASLHLLTRSSPAFSRRYVVESEVRLELARLQGSYTQTQRQVEHAEHHVQDPYGLADLLSEQASYAYGQGAAEDARILARRAAGVARRIDARFLYTRSVNLLRRLN